MLFLSPVREWRCAQPGHSVRITCSVTFLLALAALLLLALGTAFSQAAPASAPEPSDIIQFLSQTINWYRQLNVEHQIATEPSDILVINDDRQLADQAVRLSFEFARAEAQALSKQPGSQSADQGAVSSQYQSLLQLSDKLDKDVRELQTELQSARQKLETASGKKREALQATIAEVQSELDLANARRDALRSVAEFVSGASTNGLGASGLLAPATH